MKRSLLCPWWRALQRGDVIEGIFSHRRYLVTGPPDAKGTVTTRLLLRSVGYWQAAGDALITERDSSAYRKIILDGNIRTDGGAS